MSNNMSNWNIELWADCPHCEDNVDLMADPDFATSFIDGRRSLEDCLNTEGIEVFCPICDKSFVVDTEYE